MKENRKGMAQIIGWVLLVIFTVSIAAFITTWAKNQATTLSEDTVEYVEGRMDCQQVRLANLSHNCAANTVELINPGTLNIVRISAQIDDTETKIQSLDLKAQGDPKTLSIDQSFSKAR